MLKPLVAAVFSLMLALTAQTQAEEMQIKDIQIGTGAEADVGNTVFVHYTGWLMDGTKFDSSVDRGTPFSFTLGERRVIPGWEQGVVGMKVGGKRELVIPPELAYGPRGAGGVIPPNATLRFEIELLDVKAKSFTDLDNGALKARIAAGIPVIDIRTADEWRETGIIPGSHLVTFFDAAGQVNPDFGPELEKIIDSPDDEVILLCRTGNRSGMLAKYLSEQAGLTKVANVQDGIMSWIATGGEVEEPKLP
ncbi:FKBP-type peptidyl-prolyl cis-trans isomerase [Pannonibacter phragmitetus]|uniref:FKBP-type peptidyl-prolyl cis-trans isomerase n=1 Tax=Pannonibacter phragmitetus TaxID=121719 RepID=UPI000B96EF05|nr:FKBP-type peptidyl-prolyl cis-trans isomerase [Pannonibacter phragmitetus]